MLFSRLLSGVARLPALPSLCAVCHGWGAGRLCTPCLCRHATERPRCLRCAIDLPADAPTCGACLTAPPPFTRTLAAQDYDHPWDGLITRLKFHGALDLAPALAGLLVDAARRDGASPGSLLLPMPLSPARLRERGYNQAWELARRLGAALGCAADARTLLRVKDGPQQATLPLERRSENVRAAFAVAPARRESIRDRHVTLVDDVMTTGATVAEAARTLLRAGAGEVSVWVVARTPRPGDA